MAIIVTLELTNHPSERQGGGWEKPSPETGGLLEEEEGSSEVSHPYPPPSQMEGAQGLSGVSPEEREVWFSELMTYCTK